MAKILLIDDDADLLECLTAYLEFKKHSVEAVLTGLTGLERMTAGEHDLIVLDWNLPDLEGIDICRQYRSQGGSRKILMLTGMRDESSRQEGLSAGADDFLAKPFTPAQFIERITSIIES